MTQDNLPTVPADKFYQEIRALIESTKTQVIIQVNQALVLTYWQIGKTIKTEVLDDGRAHYGAAMLKQLAERLTQDYGNGFSYSGLTRMAKFYAILPEEGIVATLSQQLSWSHFVGAHLARTLGWLRQAQPTSSVSGRMGWLRQAQPTMNV